MIDYLHFKGATLSVMEHYTTPEDTYIIHTYGIVGLNLRHISDCTFSKNK
jgi:hypothetical protein